VIKAGLSALLLAPMITSTAAAQSFIGDGISTAVEAVQQGLDLIWPDELTLTDVNARVGFGYGTTPDYIGSNDYRLRLIPLIDIRYKNIWRLNGSVLTLSAYRSGNFEAGPLLNYRPGRSEDRNPVLAGLGSTGSVFQVGAFARYKTGSALASVDYRYGLSENIRSSVRLTVGHGIFKRGNFYAMLGARAKWLSKTTMQTAFGITETQAENSVLGLPAFEAGSGFSDVAVNLVGAYRINDKTRLLTLVSYGHLLSSAKHSPLVVNNVGSASQFVAGAGLVFSF